MNNQSLVLRPDVVVTVLEDGAVLLDMETKYFYSVNSSGWAILQLLENGVTEAEVTDHCLQWGASEADLKGVSEFVGLLTSDALVEAGSVDAPLAQISFDSDWIEPSLEKHKEPLQRIMTSAFDPSLPLAE